MSPQELCRDQRVPSIDVARSADPARGVEGLRQWIEREEQTIRGALESDGALRLLNTPIIDSEGYAQVAPALCGELAAYVEGSSERLQLAPKVYTSTEYPAQYDISLHNELSYASSWPSRLAFVCVAAPESGGSTSLCDGRELLRAVPSDIVDEFVDRKIRYIRNLRSADTPGLGLTWQAVFETSDRYEVERHCRYGQVDFTWRLDGTLHTEQIRPAVANHPVTGELVWFNQADQFHPSNLGRQEGLDIVEILGIDNLPIHATFGDGGDIDADALETIRRHTAELTIAEPWHEREILVLDNMLMMHGRTAFSGTRSVLVAMGS